MGPMEGSAYVTAEGITRHPGRGWFSFNASYYIGEEGRQKPAELPVIVLPSEDLHIGMRTPIPLEQIRAERIAVVLNPFKRGCNKEVHVAISHKIIGLVGRWLIDEHPRPKVRLKVFEDIVEGVFGKGYFDGMHSTEKEGVLTAQATPLLRAYEELRGSNVPSGVIIRGLMRGDPIHTIAQGLSSQGSE